MPTLSDLQLASSTLADPKLLSERLAMFAADTERSGFPFVAEHIRNLAHLVLAEKGAAAAIRG